MKQFYTLFFGFCLLASSVQSKSIFFENKHKEAILFNTTIDGGKHGLIITPNPATGDALIHFNALKQSSAIIEILDESGKVIMTQQTELYTGKNKININQFISLVEGSYTIRLVTNSKTYSTNFLMWK
jgi:hypothetical protein